MRVTLIDVGQRGNTPPYYRLAIWLNDRRVLRIDGEALNGFDWKLRPSDAELVEIMLSL